MAHVIPVAITSRETLPPPADPVGEVFAVTAAGAVVQLLQRFPIAGGAGVYSGRGLPAPGLRWALRVLEDGAGGAALFRSGPLRRLPGLPTSPLFATRVEIHRTAGLLTLDEGDGLPEILTTRLRATLPPPLQLSRVELDVDGEGRYVVRASGRLPLPARLLPFVYERPLRLRSGPHPGRARQAVVARPEGPARMRGANLRPFAAALDAAIAAAAEEQLAEVARHIARLSAIAAGLAYTPTRVAVTSVALGPTGQDVPAVSAAFRFSPGAITGGVVPADPPEPPVA